MGRFLRPPDWYRACPAPPSITSRPHSSTAALHLVTLDDNGHGNLWDIQPQSWARRACQIAGRTLTRTEWNSALPERTYVPGLRGR